MAFWRPTRGAAAVTVCFLITILLLLTLLGTDPVEGDDSDVQVRHLALDRRKREHTSWYSPSLQEITNEVRPRKRKGRRKKPRNGTTGLRKRKRLRLYNQSSAGLLMPKPGPGVIGNTIIRTSEGNGPQHTILIQTLNNSNSSSVRYFPNLPVQWMEHRGPTRHQPRPASFPRTEAPRYGEANAGWRGLSLAHGKSLLNQIIADYKSKYEGRNWQGIEREMGISEGGLGGQKLQVIADDSQ